MPSFGGEVKPLVPCRRFAACKRSLNGEEKASFRQNYRTPFSPTVPPFATKSAGFDGDVEMSKGGGKQWQTTSKYLHRMQRVRAMPVA
jgi:hypothetical protein